MSNEIEFHYEGEIAPPMLVRFILSNDDTITVGGNSVPHVFFEVMRKFPEKFICKSVGFSGQNETEAEERLKEFFALARKYGKL